MILERQGIEGWGISIVERLSTDLQQEFPSVGGFSAQNLWYMRQFYRQYHESPILQPLVGEIGWAHNLVIMGKCKDPREREFYLRITRKFGWTKSASLFNRLSQFKTLFRYEMPVCIPDCDTGRPSLFILFESRPGWIRRRIGGWAIEDPMHVGDEVAFDELAFVLQACAFNPRLI